MWPVNGGGLAVSPGIFSGHAQALMYINMGLGTEPDNYSVPMVSMFELVGPGDRPHDGSFCLPLVQIPRDISVQPGDHATIQVVQSAQHGAVTYNVR